MANEGKSELAFYAWIIGLAALALMILSYYLNKGVRDIVKGVIAPVVGFIGGKVKETGIIADETATDFGYYYMSDNYPGDPHDLFLKARSLYAAAHGYKYAQASNPPGFPSEADWLAGVKPL